MRAVFLLLVALFSSSQAHALTTVGGLPTVQYTNSGMTFLDSGGSATSFVGRNFAVGSARGITLTEQVAAPLGGRSVTATVARTIGSSEWALGIVAVGGAFYGGCAAGTALANLAGMGTSAGNGARTSCNVVNAVDDWLMDPGQASTPATNYEAGFNSFSSNKWGTGTSPGQACQAVATANSYTVGTTTQTYAVISASPTSCMMQGTVTQCPSSCSTSTGNVFDAGMRVKGTVQTCPASIDALNPAFNVAAGSAPGPDGKCPTGRYNHVSAADASAALAAYADVTKVAPLLDQAVTAGKTFPIADPRHVTDVTPTAVPGTPVTTTTTNPDGSTVTTVKTPTEHFAPDGADGVNFTTTYSTTTNTCTGAGSCTSSSTNTTVPGSAKPDDPTDPCTANPDRLGCLSLGAPGSDKPQWQEKTVPFTPEDLGFGGACPAPQVWHLPYLNRDLSWSYSAACDVAPTVRAGLLALASLGALLFIIKTVRT